jgi:hypothetical protein
LEDAEIWRIEVHSQPWQIIHETSISKITTAKWTGGVAQAVEHLFFMREAPSSNPRPTKKKKNHNGGLQFLLSQCLSGVSVF